MSSNIKLVKASKEYQTQIEEMLLEWKKYNKENPEANTSPWAIFQNYKTFDEYLYYLNEAPKYYDQNGSGLVPDSTFFALDIDRNIMVGAVNIRHYLNERLLNCGGHIGDGVRPSERRKGYGTIIIKLALEECKKLGIDKVMMSCDKDNKASRKTIVNNGGIYDCDLTEEDGNIIERYWINV